MLLLELVVVGCPVSHQTNNRPLLHAWREKVRSLAAKRWNGPPSTDALRFVVTHFHRSRESPLDDDNMVKPLRDALIGLVYNDDRQITDSATRQSWISGPFKLDETLVEVVQAIRQRRTFVYIRIESAPDHSRLLT